MKLFKRWKHSGEDKPDKSGTAAVELMAPPATASLSNLDGADAPEQLGGEKTIDGQRVVPEPVSSPERVDSPERVNSHD